jgi:hypothetical protein
MRVRTQRSGRSATHPFRATYAHTAAKPMCPAPCARAPMEESTLAVRIRESTARSREYARAADPGVGQSSLICRSHGVVIYWSEAESLSEREGDVRRGGGKDTHRMRKEAKGFLKRSTRVTSHPPPSLFGSRSVTTPLNAACSRSRPHRRRRLRRRRCRRRCRLARRDELLFPRCRHRRRRA